MDLVEFLKFRMDFVRYFYRISSAPFVQTLDAIKEESEPYVPVYDESGEPQFLSEWQDAEAGLQAVGLTALSMVSSAFELFLANWVRLRLPKGAMDRYQKRGRECWWLAYKRLLSSFGIDVAQAQVNDALIEQTVLARNRGQHPPDLLSNEVRHSHRDLRKNSAAYFVAEGDINASQMNEDGGWWLPPRIHVDSAAWRP